MSAFRVSASRVLLSHRSLALLPLSSACLSSPHPGKTLIARDLNVAAQLSLDHNLDTITLAGDRVDKKGALTGGYSDFGGRSRLQAQADIAATQDRFADLQKEIVAIKNELRSQTKRQRA